LGAPPCSIGPNFFGFSAMFSETLGISTKVTAMGRNRQTMWRWFMAPIEMVLLGTAYGIEFTTFQRWTSICHQMFSWVSRIWSITTNSCNPCRMALQNQRVTQRKGLTPKESGETTMRWNATVVPPENMCNEELERSLLTRNWRTTFLYYSSPYNTYFAH